MRTWVPTAGSQFGFLVTHNEAISISDYYTVREGDKPVFRPTCHYAYHPADDAVLSLHEMFGKAAQVQEQHHILDETEIVDGIDELGVLVYGHEKNAYWYGSQLSIEETRRVAPYQNATGLQVTSAVLAGMVWALENPEAGIVEADEMDFRRCLEVQTRISARSWACTRTGRRSPTVRACSRRTSTPAIRGSSATCWCTAEPPRRAGAGRCRRRGCRASPRSAPAVTGSPLPRRDGSRPDGGAVPDRAMPPLGPAPRKHGHRGPRAIAARRWFGYSA